MNGDKILSIAKMDSLGCFLVLSCNRWVDSLSNPVMVFSTAIVDFSFYSNVKFQKQNKK